MSATAGFVDARGVTAALLALTVLRSAKASPPEPHR